MKILQTKKHLLRNDPDEVDCDASLLVPLNEGEEVLAQRLKDQTYMFIVGADMVE